MLRVALRLCSGNRDLAEECVQEATVNAFIAFSAEKFRDLDNFKPWILRILTNVYLQEVRRAKKVVQVTDFELLCDSFPTKTEVNHQHLSPEIEQALAMLSPDQRMCITLIDIDDLDYAETANILNIPIGTVRSRTARARLKMAEILATQEKELITHG